MFNRFGSGRASAVLAVAGVGLLFGASATRAETVMQQCGQQYQAAKVANTLNGQNWTQFRTECAARLKAGGPQPATAAGAAVAPTPASAPATNPLNPTPEPTPAAAPVPVAPAAKPTTTAAVSTGKPSSPGRTAFVARERQCGSEWKANKVSLAAQTPGLTWPKYLSQCNARLKAAGQ